MNTFKERCERAGGQVYDLHSANSLEPALKGTSRIVSPDGTLPDGVSSDSALPGGVSPDGTSSGGAFPDGTSSDGTLPDGVSSDSKLPDDGSDRNLSGSNPSGSNLTENDPPDSNPTDRGARDSDLPDQKSGGGINASALRGLLDVALKSDFEEVFIHPDIQNLIGEAGLQEFSLHFPERKIVCPETAPPSPTSKSLGIVNAQFGIAETGSVVLLEEFSYETRLNTLSSTLLVLLPESQILPTLPDCNDQLKDLMTQGWVTFMTGVSCTGDIEMVTVRGIQGPEELLVGIY